MRQAAVVAGWFDDAIILKSRMLVVDAFASPLAYLLSCVTLLIHLAWAEHASCSVHFQRAGADVSLIAAALFAVSTWYSPPPDDLDGGAPPRFRLGSPFFALPVLAVLGTLVWGYGDMLPFGDACH